MKKIRIFAAPAGPEPLAWRQEWIGCEIPINAERVRKEVARTRDLTLPLVDGYDVLTDDAIRALAESGRVWALVYWLFHRTGPVLRFDKAVCELIDA